jgi:hypothetical protein
MRNFSLKKLLNNIVIIPDDRMEFAKMIVAFLLTYSQERLTGFNLTPSEIVLATYIIKGFLDTLHFYINKKDVEDSQEIKEPNKGGF